MIADNNHPKECLYIFLDEAGNFDFSSSGTNYFMLTSLTKYRPFEVYKALTELKYDLIESGQNMDCFHASEDSQITRDRVFNIISTHLAEVRLDCLIAEKRQIDTSLHRDDEFYPRMIRELLRHVLGETDLGVIHKVVIITDRIPVQKKRKVVEKAVKKTLAALLPERLPYHIFHHEAKSNMDLQVVDYCNWAVYRLWDRKDSRSHDRIRSAISSLLKFISEGKEVRVEKTTAPTTLSGGPHGPLSSERNL